MNKELDSLPKTTLPPDVCPTCRWRKKPVHERECAHCRTVGKVESKSKQLVQQRLKEAADGSIIVQCPKCSKNRTIRDVSDLKSAPDCPRCGHIMTADEIARAVKKASEKD